MPRSSAAVRSTVYEYYYVVHDVAFDEFLQQSELDASHKFKASSNFMRICSMQYYSTYRQRVHFTFHSIQDYCYVASATLKHSFVVLYAKDGRKCQKSSGATLPE